MKKIPFVKMQASGNDFIVIESCRRSPVTGHRKNIQKLCDRKFGIGADGVLVIGPSRKADARMRIFNADGSEAEMCGNGARCVAWIVCHKVIRSQGHKVSLETKAGTVEAVVKKNSVRIKLTDPVDLKLDLNVTAFGKTTQVDFVNTGVPHAVVEVSDLEAAPVRELGRALRRHKIFAPAGTNVDFIKWEGPDSIAVRTYERGVEDETLACGTGSVAGAIIAVLNHGVRAETRSSHRVFVRTQSGEVLKIAFEVSKYKVSDVWLEGGSRVVFEGEYFI